MKIQVPGQPVIPDFGVLVPEKTNVAGETTKPIEDPSHHQDTIHNDSRGRSMQSDLRLAGNLQQTQLQSQFDVLGNGSSGPQVKQLQNQLNEWRATQGKPPIGADGIFGKETEAALRDFQQATGLKEDGLAGPKVKERLSAELKMWGDPHYQALSPDAQKMAMVKLMEKPNDPTHVANVKETVQDLAGLERNPKFQQLPAETQQTLKFTMLEHSSRPGSRADLIDLGNDDKFHGLTPDQQENALATIVSNAHAEGGQAIPAFTRNILNSKTLAGPKDEGLTNAVLSATKNVAPEADRLYELQELLNNPAFVALPREDQMAMLNGFSGRSGVQMSA